MDPITLGLLFLGIGAAVKSASGGNSRNTSHSRSSGEKSPPSFEPPPWIKFKGDRVHRSDDDASDGFHLTGVVGRKTKHFPYTGQTTLGMYGEDLPGARLHELIASKKAKPSAFAESGFDWAGKEKKKKEPLYGTSTYDLSEVLEGMQERENKQRKKSLNFAGVPQAHEPSVTSWPAIRTGPEEYPWPVMKPAYSRAESEAHYMAPRLATNGYMPAVTSPSANIYVGQCSLREWADNLPMFGGNAHPINTYKW